MFLDVDANNSIFHVKFQIFSSKEVNAFISICNISTT
jgi:hypothetical protein